MRFDKKVTFWRDGGNRYIPGKGHVSEPNQVATRMANVTDMGISRGVHDFGAIKHGQKILRCVAPVGGEWDYCEIEGDSKRYTPVTDVSPLKLQTYLVGEVKQ